MSERAKPPAHGVAASWPEPLTDPALVAAEVDRLGETLFTCALALSENDWRAAARAAYTAAWSYHRLPRAEQEALVVSSLHDDDGPLPVDDDWSASAFVAWLIYRIQSTAPLATDGRTTPAPTFDAFGRKYTAGAEPNSAPESSDARATNDAPATPESSQASLFEVTANVRGRL